MSRQNATPLGVSAALAVPTSMITAEQLAPELEREIRRLFDAKTRNAAKTRRQWPKGRGI